MKLSKFLTSKGVIYAIILAIFYQVMMVGLFMHGYHVLPSGVYKLGINVVNLDGEQGAAIQKELTASLPFDKVKLDESLEQSKKKLNDREIQMILVIPKDFVKNLQTGESVFDFYINQSNPTTVVATMESVAKSITDNFNQAMKQGKLAGILSSFNVDDSQQISIMEQMNQSVAQNNIYLNQTPKSMDYIMAPTFLSVGTYASSMVVTIILVNILNAIIPFVGKWKGFFYIEITGCIVAVFASLFGVITGRLLIDFSGLQFLQMYLQQAFMQITAFQFTLIFSLSLGQNGIFLNIPLLLAQTIAGGGTMPLQIMPRLFKAISYITPMYPNTQADYGLLFGGPIIRYEIRLLMLFIISSVILFALVRFKREKGNTPVNG